MRKNVYDQRDVIVLGAGLVGSLLSIALSQRGHEVTIFEKRIDPRKTIYGEGRSINLALSDRGLRTLAATGLEQQILLEAVAMKGRMVHERDSSLHFHPYSEEGKVIYSISRIDLNKILIDKAEENNVSIFFENRCKKVLLGKKMIELEAGVERELNQFQYQYIFGADGAFSRLRKEMMGHSGFNYSQQYINYGYKELTIPSNNGMFVMEPNALHIWPRGEFMLIALPNRNGSFTCTLFLSMEGENSFGSLDTSEKLFSFFNVNFPDVVSYMGNLEAEFFAKSPSFMVTINCHPWVHKSEAALIGDAAHAILPFYGQGMNAGFEDVYIICDLLDQGFSMEECLVKYNGIRKSDTDAISKLAYHNFIEMRDLVADPAFILRKEIESQLHIKYPFYRSLYSMVTFSTIPYSKALEEGQKQDEMFKAILALHNIADTWKTEIGWMQIENVFRTYYVIAQPYS